MMSNKKPQQKIIDSLTKNLTSISAPISVADASSKSGLSFEDSKAGLNFLLAEYRGHIAATSMGELLYSFPYGFSKPWEKKEFLDNLINKSSKLFMGGLKFLVRAWISIVMVGYVAIFAVILIALSFSKSSDDRDNSPSFGSSLMFHALFRMILDSLFWTFHPFSPFYVGSSGYDSFRPKVAKTPFYERVNRFFFGPTEVEISQQDLIKNVLQEIRAQKGRIGIFDVMKVTGLSKRNADILMSKLMLDYEGEVLVSEQGGIYYEFINLRKTSLNELSTHAEPVWCKKALLPPFTGNTASSNLLIFSLNSFNLIMGFVGITNHWTIEHLKLILQNSMTQDQMLINPQVFGPSLLLGWIPFSFSLFLFLIPLTRLFFRSNKEEKIKTYNGRNGLIKALLTKLTRFGIKEEALKTSWQEQAGAAPKESSFIRETIKLGGELELDDNAQTRFRFRDLEAEKEALEKARASSSARESYVGEIIFDSRK